MTAAILGLCWRELGMVDMIQGGCIYSGSVVWRSDLADGAEHMGIPVDAQVTKEAGLRGEIM